MTIGEIVAQLGGSGVITAALLIGAVKFIRDRAGNFVEAHIVEKIKKDHAQALEKLKAELARSTELYKGNVTKNIESFKFELPKYGELWNSLCELQASGDTLWADATISHLVSFQAHLRSAETLVRKHSYYLPEHHFNQLQEIIEAFQSFNVGKEELIRLRDAQIDPLTSVQEAINLVQQNGASWQRYTRLLGEMRREVRSYLHGPLEIPAS